MTVNELLSSEYKINQFCDLSLGCVPAFPFGASKGRIVDGICGSQREDANYYQIIQSRFQLIPPNFGCAHETCQTGPSCPCRVADNSEVSSDILYILMVRSDEDVASLQP